MVRLKGIRTFLLKAVCFHLVSKPDSTPFLLQIYENTAFLTPHVLKRKNQLLTTVTLH
ncbi:MAG: hypothetical protein BWY82_02298 [Verrucomicrobia bacterium ADurb.Bin474]|nr:MAG: hypothetical protein BWY82_02298 [Verrucomicrobia bacterium ADurb.Bin474]